MAIGFISLSIFSIRGSRQSLVPLYASEEFGFDTGQVGLIFTGIGVVGLLLVAPAGWLADNSGRKPVIVLAGFFAAIGTAAAAFAPGSGLFVAAPAAVGGRHQHQRPGAGGVRGRHRPRAPAGLGHGDLPDLG